MLRRSFLKENRSNWYQSMMLTGKLERHLDEIEKTAQERMEILVAGLQQEHPAPDKEADPLAWTAHMNMLTAMAEECVMNDLV
ncbi:TnpV protein, partial [Marvinbryantia sp.]